MKHFKITINTNIDGYDSCWGKNYLAQDISEATGIPADDIEISDDDDDLN